MDEAAPAEAGAAAEKKKRPLLRRVPTALIVTLLGIALTAWLLPAVTRQWDDRQKAHELQAALVADMATATAGVLTGAERLRGTPPDQKSRERLVEQWSRTSVQIEARLIAYFPGETAVAWQLLEFFIDRYVGIKGAESQRALDFAVDWIFLNRFHEGMAVQIATTGLVFEDLADREGVFLDGFERRIFHETMGTLGLSHAALVHARGLRYVVETGRAPGGVTNVPRGLVYQLFALQTQISAQLLAAHPTGYSTTFRDLFHDLLPF